MSIFRSARTGAGGGGYIPDLSEESADEQLIHCQQLATGYVRSRTHTERDSGNLETKHISGKSLCVGRFLRIHPRRMCSTGGVSSDMSVDQASPRALEVSVFCSNGSLMGGG